MAKKGMVSPDPKKRMKYAVSLYLVEKKFSSQLKDLWTDLLLMEKGKLSPGAGSPSPPLLQRMSIEIVTDFMGKSTTDFGRSWHQYRLVKSTWQRRY